MARKQGISRLSSDSARDRSRRTEAVKQNRVAARDPSSRRSKFFLYFRAQFRRGDDQQGWQVVLNTLQMKVDSERSRLNWVDIAKGIGIVLVVIGHTIRGLAAGGVLEWSAAVQLCDSWIYSFHMPVFFFLSGLFLYGSATKGKLWSFISDKLRTIAYPYVVWSVITIILKSLLGHIPNTPRWLTDLPLVAYAPVEQFWFLYVLFLLTVAIGAMFWFGLKPWLVLVIAGLFYTAPLMVGWSVLSQARDYSIYVALGTTVGPGLISAIATSTLLPLVAVVGLAVPVFTQTEPFAAILGIAGCIALALLLDRVKRGELLSFLGRHSLTIFVVHSIASAAARFVLLVIGVRAPAIHFMLGIGSGLFVPIVLEILLAKLHFNYGFTFPR